MIGKLTGKIDEISNDYVIIDINGVGYLVYTSAKTASLFKIGMQVSLFIETYVREDLINLYGFSSREEKNCFNLLTEVSGVGTRVAMSILSIASPNEVFSAINLRDKEMFRRVSGIGPKLAERIILELKDKVAHVEFSGAKLNISSSENSGAVINDALSALVNLGISRPDAYNIINKIVLSNPSISLDELIKQSLQGRGML